MVDARGEAADVRRLWDLLIAQGDYAEKYDTGNPNLLVTLAGEEYTYALEVGLGTIEVNTMPCRDLFAVERIMEDAVSRLVRAALTFGWRVLGYGIQPVSAPSLPLMSPKQRYQSLYRAMGREWLWYTVTAADQVQVDVARHEMVDMLNFGNLMAPVLIALCANSPVYGGTLSPFCSGREGEMALIHANEARHGMPAAPYASIEEYVLRNSRSQYLILQSDGEVVPSSQHFVEHLAEHGGPRRFTTSTTSEQLLRGRRHHRTAPRLPAALVRADGRAGLGPIEAADTIMPGAGCAAIRGERMRLSSARSVAAGWRSLRPAS